MTTKQQLGDEWTKKQKEREYFDSEYTPRVSNPEIERVKGEIYASPWFRKSK